MEIQHFHFQKGKKEIGLSAGSVHKHAADPVDLSHPVSLPLGKGSYFTFLGSLFSTTFFLMNPLLLLTKVLSLCHSAAETLFWVREPLRFCPAWWQVCVYRWEQTRHVVKKKKEITKLFYYSSRILKRVTATSNRRNTAVKKQIVCVCSALALIETGPTGSYYSGVA